MANNANNVSFGKPNASGAIWVAPYGTTVPTDATSTLGNAFKNVGYISEDGLVNEVSTDVESIKAWGGDTVLSGQSSFEETFTFNAIETNEEALKLYYGDDNVVVSGNNITITQSSAPLPRISVVIEVVLTGGRIKRIVVKNGQIADRSGDVSYTDGDAISYPIKLTALPDENGNTHVEYVAVTAGS